MAKDLKYITMLSLCCSALLLSSAYVLSSQNGIKFKEVENLSGKDLSQEVSAIRYLTATSGSFISADENASHSLKNDTLNDDIPPPDVYQTNAFIANTDPFESLVGLNSLSSERVKSIESFELEKAQDLSQSSVDNTKKTLEFNPYADNSKNAYKDVIHDDFQNALYETNNKREVLPFIAELENEIVIEFPQAFGKPLMQRVISRLLTLPQNISPENLIANASIDTRQKPYFYHRVVDHNDRVIRYPGQAYPYAQYLLDKHIKNIDEDNGRYIVVRIPLKEPPALPLKAQNLHPWVKKYSTEFNVPEDLIFAIMKTESLFNHRAVSKANALGLMQIRPKSAGKDVYKHIDGRSGYPSKTALFDPKENIRIGVAYLALLQNKYLKGVRNSQNREILAIASYNGGVSRALKPFGKTPAEAIARINKLHPKNVYKRLRIAHSAAETRDYVGKVIKNKDEFSYLVASAR